MRSSSGSTVEVIRRWIYYCTSIRIRCSFADFFPFLSLWSECSECAVSICLFKPPKTLSDLTKVEVGLLKNSHKMVNLSSSIFPNVRVNLNSFANWIYLFHCALDSAMQKQFSLSTDLISFVCTDAPQSAKRGGQNHKTQVNMINIISGKKD